MVSNQIDAAILAATLHRFSEIDISRNCIHYRPIRLPLRYRRLAPELFILSYPFVLNRRMSNHYMQTLCSSLRSSTTVALRSTVATVTRDRRLQDIFIRCFVQHQVNWSPSRSCVAILHVENYMFPSPCDCPLR